MLYGSGNRSQALPDLSTVTRSRAFALDVKLKGSLQTLTAQAAAAAAAAVPSPPPPPPATTAVASAAARP
jgi:hypothetical protein